MNKKGAMFGLRPFVLSLVMVILGAFFIISFAVLFIQETNPTSPVLGSQYGLNASVSTMQDSLNGFKTISNDAQTTLSKSTPSAVDYLFLIFRDAFYIPLSFLQFASGGIATIGTLIFTLTLGSVAGGSFASVSGILQIVSGIIMSGLIVTIVLLIIRAIRVGDSG